MLALVLSSCSKEDAQLQKEIETAPDSKLATITITAYGENDPNETKTVVAGDDFNKIHWNANEKIAVFYNQTLNMFTSTNTSVSPESDFTGTIEGITDPSQLDGKEVIGLYPYNANATISSSGVVTTTLPSYQVAVDDTFGDNLSISMGKSTDNATKMKFYNVCSGLCFTVSHSDIKTVTLRSINGENISGDVTIKFATVEGKEVPQVQSIIDNANASSIITLEAPNGGTFTPGKRYYIIALPQILSSGLVIEGFREDGTVYETAINKSITLKRAVFARKTEFDNGLTPEDLYNYTLTVSEPSSGTLGYTGGTMTNGYKVYSYRQLKSDATKRFPVEWKVLITTDDGTTWNDLTEENKSTYNAGWLTLEAYSAIPPSVEGTTYAYSAEKVELSIVVDSTNSHTMALINGVHKSGIDNSIKANAIDLSMYDLLGNSISQTTANCYIVNAPGWYKFPMVYGNAIKNGVTNSNSFTSSLPQVQRNSKDAVLMNFVDHDGSNITQPWVTNAHSGGAYAISKTELVWQDEKDLVTDITIGNSGANTDYIYFYVDKESIHQGNAVIAAYTGETVAWSWHIWVTDQDMSAIPVKNYQGTINYFLPVNLGWSDGGTNVSYLARNVKLRFVQTIGTRKCSHSISQNGSTIYVYRNNPYYQWGRKDPILPSKGGTLSLTNKTWYNKDGIDSQILDLADLNNGNTGVAAIKDYIQNPGTFHFKPDMDGQYHNLWGSDPNTYGLDGTLVKTVYDPSPIGYCIPERQAFTGFTVTGESVDHMANMNISGTFSMGWNFKTNLDDGTIFFFAGGCRLSAADPSSILIGRLGNFGYNGYYWTSPRQYMMNFTNNSLTPVSSASNQGGLSVRACQEK